MIERDFDIDKLLWPMSSSDFINQHFEKSPFIQCRDDPGYYSGLLTLSECEFLAFTLNMPKNHSWLSLVRGGVALPLTTDEREELRPSQIVSGYHQGYTIILRQLAKRWPPISMLCKNLEEYFNASTPVLLKGNITANLYLTPRNAQGFEPHYDDHDVFILQLEGSKNWTLYNELAKFPIEPLGHIPPELLGDPLHSVHLNSGDLLYIPRGCPHEASTTGDYSMHLTVGIHTYTWSEVIDTIVKSDAASRSSLPFGSPNQVPLVSHSKDQLDELLQNLSNEENLQEALEKLRSSHLTNLFPLPNDYLDQINHLTNLNRETVVCKRHGEACQIIREERQLSIRFPGNVVHYPKYTEAAFRFMVACNNFSVSSIPGFSNDNEQLGLVRGLIGNGFLKMVEQPEVRDHL